MFKFIVNGQVIATATNPIWFQPLFDIYPNGTIEEGNVQPVATGAQTL